MVQPQGHSEEKITEKTPKIEKIPEKEKTREREQKQEGTSEPLMDINIDPKLIKEWEQFDSIISNPNKSKEFTTPEVARVQNTEVNTVPIVETSDPPRFQQDMEIIPKNPTKKIVLQIE